MFLRVSLVSRRRPSPWRDEGTAPSPWAFPCVHHVFFSFVCPLLNLSDRLWTLPQWEQDRVRGAISLSLSLCLPLYLPASLSLSLCVVVLSLFGRCIHFCWLDYHQKIFVITWILYITKAVILNADMLLWVSTCIVHWGQSVNQLSTIKAR